MDFSRLIRRLAGSGLPMLGQALAGPAGGVVANMIAGRLGLETEDPAMIEQAIAANPGRIADLQELQIEKRHELEIFAQQAATQAVSQVNETMRIEARAEDPWSRRWRPFWGFVSAVAFGVAILGVLVLAFSAAWSGEWGALGAIPPIVNALMILFGIPGAILGITAHHRGRMQRVQAGEIIGDRPVRGIRDMFAGRADASGSDPG